MRKPHAVRKLEEPCPFCQHVSCELWRDPSEMAHPFQVRCSSCGARGPVGDCGEEVAVPAWLEIAGHWAFQPENDEGGLDA